VKRGDLIHLGAGAAHVDIAPGIGGALAGYWSERDGERLDWLRPMTAAALAAGDVLAASSFPLVPFSNRIRQGRFSFGGRMVELPRNFDDHPHAIHGHGWQSAWTVDAVGFAQASLSFRHDADTWPWDYSARQHFSLTPEGLIVVLELTNESADEMPAGLGFHPYFPRNPDTSIVAKVEQVWRTDEEVMPRSLETPGEFENPALGIRADAVVLDNCFTGWNRHAQIVWPDRHAILMLTASSALDYVVVFTPPGADFLCVEPVSHATDAFNLAANGGDAAMMVLSPGQTRKVSMTFAPHQLPG
jgi:aldose 1-epimerase